MDKWREFSGGLQLSKNDRYDNKSKFNKALQKCFRTLFPQSMYKDQYDYLKEMQCPGDLPPEEYVECIYIIKKQPNWYEPGAVEYLLCELNW